MKNGVLTIVLAAVALMVGVAVGGLGPRSSVRQLEKQLAEREECTPAMGSDIAKVFQGRPWRDETKKVQPTPVPADPIEPERKPTGEPDQEQEQGIHFEFGEGEQGSEEDLDQSLGMAREAMELRYAQAREALLQNARPTEEQLSVIDASMEQMNQELQVLADDLSAVVKNGREPGRREAMEFAADALDTLLNAEDRLRQALTPEQIAAMQEESLDPTAYIQPSIVDSLTGLNGAIRNRR